MMTDT